MANVILRPVFNRPEMLFLSFEYEQKAREYYNFPEDFITLFLIEFGADKKVKDLVKSYPYPAKYVVREKKFGLTINILEGMKVAFDLADDFVIHLEDDILLHETYFKYIDLLLSEPELEDKWSVISPYSKNDDGDVHVVEKKHHYAALAPVISKKFHVDYVLPCSNKNYYSNPPKFITEINNKYKEHWKRKYKYTNTAHYEQAGLINRLVDVALIEEDKYVIMPQVNRQQHIGYFGKNRPGGVLPGRHFEDRLENLREIIKDPSIMYKLSSTKQYNDYLAFSPKLNEWNGTLIIK